MCCNSSRCKASLQEASVTLLLLHALRHCCQSCASSIQKDIDSLTNKPCGKTDVPCERNIGSAIMRSETALGLRQLGYARSTAVGIESPVTRIIGATLLASIPLVNRSTPYSTFQSFKTIKGTHQISTAHYIMHCYCIPLVHGYIAKRDQTCRVASITTK
jgi:hypothetical protein